MGTDRDGNMTGQDPLSSTAEGDDDPGTAALADAATEDDEEGRAPTFAEAGPPPEAADDTPVTDASPEENLGLPEA